MSGLIPARSPVRVLRSRFPGCALEEQEFEIEPVRADRGLQLRFNRALSSPSVYVPLALYLLGGSVLTILSGWAVKTIVPYYLVLPAAVAFVMFWIGSNLGLIIDVCKAKTWSLRRECLVRPRWAYVFNALIVGFYTGAALVAWAHTLTPVR